MIDLRIVIYFWCFGSGVEWGEEKLGCVSIGIGPSLSLWLRSSRKFPFVFRLVGVISGGTCRDFLSLERLTDE